MTTNSNRPLSPHLQVYKLPLTAIFSILHRMTGVMLSIGLIFVVYILSATAGGYDTYNDMQNIMDNGFLRLIYWGFIYALFFHLCHGVRHLIWDSGEGFSKDSMDRNSTIELLASLVLTLATFILF